MQGVARGPPGLVGQRAPSCRHSRHYMRSPNPARTHAALRYQSVDTHVNDRIRDRVPCTVASNKLVTWRMRAAAAQRNFPRPGEACGRCGAGRRRRSCSHLIRPATAMPESLAHTDFEMFALMHEMRSRIIQSPSFDGDRIIGAILSRTPWIARSMAATRCRICGT